jgi:NAD(P)-dependent dehydrogenase (short-subunit alcohol dehydrogenase family)
MKKTAVLITGAAKNIGKNIALTLAKDGYDIALHYHHSEAAALETAATIRAYQVVCQIFQADLSQESELFRLLPRVRESFDDVGVLINNASVFKKAPQKDTEPGEFDRHVAINLKAPYFLMQDFARHCKKGHIINLLDTKIASRTFSSSAYMLSKHALASCTKMAACEFAPNIRVNGIAPGTVLPPPGKDEEYLRQRSARTLLQTSGSLENISHAVTFLLANPFITGQIIFVNGGEDIP